MIRKQKGLMQREVASVAGMQASNYSKIESGKRDVSVEALGKIAQLFGITVDEIIHFDDVINPEPIKVEDKTTYEKLHLINQLQEDDKNTVYKIIDTMLTKQKFQTFFEQNIQTTK